MRYAALILLMIAVLGPCPVVAQEGEELLIDRNGDEIISVMGYGDSLTFGVGDGIPVGTFVDDPPRVDGNGGYLTRIRDQLGVPTVNAGKPGERLAATGILRFPGAVLGSNSDVVLIMEGTNDSLDRTPSSTIRAALQRLINVTLALGRQPVLLTLPPPCCNHSGPELFTRVYSGEIRALAAVNGLPLADVERAWASTCSSLAACDLYNLPEGLHPNARGYDVIAQTVAAALLRIDIFIDGAAADLEEALGLPEGTVVVQPDMEAE